MDIYHSGGNNKQPQENDPHQQRQQQQHQTQSNSFDHHHLYSDRSNPINQFSELANQRPAVIEALSRVNPLKNVYVLLGDDIELMCPVVGSGQWPATLLTSNNQSQSDPESDQRQSDMYWYLKQQHQQSGKKSFSVDNSYNSWHNSKQKPQHQQLRNNMAISWRKGE